MTPTGIVNGVPYTIEESVIRTLATKGIDVVSEVERGIMNSTMTATLYSKSNCPFCVRAKRLLDEKGVGYTEESAVEKRDELIRLVTSATGEAPRTVPQIWLGDSYIGGYDSLVEHFKKNS